MHLFGLDFRDNLNAIVAKRGNIIAPCLGSGPELYPYGAQCGGSLCATSMALVTGLGDTIMTLCFTTNSCV